MARHVRTQPRPATAEATTPVLGPEGPKTPIRVMWLIKGLGPGGAERLLCHLAEVRNRTDFVYQAAYLMPEKSTLVSELERSGVPVVCLDAPGRGTLGWATRVRRRLLEQPVDILHFHSPFPAAVGRVVARSLPRAARPRLITTEHNTWSAYGRATWFLNALTYRMDDAHIAVSEAVRESVPRVFGRRAHVVVVHGVPVERIREELRRREETRSALGVRPGELLLGTVANFRTHKAYPDLLEAARRVIDAGHQVRFVAVGQGRLEDQIRERHDALDLRERFALLGYREDAVRVLAACDVFVLASLFEGMPVSLMEALALGVPVVATAVGGIPELVTNGVEGLLVRPSAPEALATALGELIADPARRAEMSQAAAARAAQLDVRSAACRIEDVYRAVVTR